MKRWRILKIEKGNHHDRSTRDIETIEVLDQVTIERRIQTCLKYSVSLCIQSECGKMRTRITPNTDTFSAVVISLVELEKAYPM